MKKLILLVLLCLPVTGLYAQIPDTIPQLGFAFPIGSKLTLKMVEIDSGKFLYYILKYEPFDSTINTDEKENIFKNQPALNTIDLIFCVGTHGETQKEKDENLQVLLMMKNGTKYPLEYMADIIRYQQKDFEPTSVVPIFPGALNTEMWPYYIEQIGLHDFKRWKN